MPLHCWRASQVYLLWNWLRFLECWFYFLLLLIQFLSLILHFMFPYITSLCYPGTFIFLPTFYPGPFYLSLFCHFSFIILHSVYDFKNSVLKISSSFDIPHTPPQIYFVSLSLCVLCSPFFMLRTLFIGPNLDCYNLILARCISLNKEGFPQVWYLLQNRLCRFSWDSSFVHKYCLESPSHSTAGWYKFVLPSHNPEESGEEARWYAILINEFIFYICCPVYSGAATPELVSHLYFT